uniref:Tetratricopeptide repeat protein n=1 Tax=Eiseniibacteriota bacterium TaxID=2212470 RepID=A0A832I1F8_UNCEI
MQAFVFTDESLARHAGRFVWLSMDGEKAVNAGLRARLALVGYPSFYVVDPATERVAFRWVGAFTAPQFPRVLDAAENALRGGGTPLDRLAARADSLYAVGRDSAAAVIYREALAAAPADWPHAPRVLESLLFALLNSGQRESCAALARERLPSLGRTGHAAAVAGLGLDAALALPAQHPERAALVAALEPALRGFVADTAVTMADDDRSGLWIVALAARKDARDSTGARATAEAWSAFLEQAAARAPTPAARTVFDSHRLSAYLEIGRPERAAAMLEVSARDFPNDYNPPARLAVALRAMGRLDEALAAADRALALAYGPRRVNVFRTRAEILLERGDRDGARATLRDAERHVESLPAPQRSAAALADLRRRLAALE